MSNQSIIDQINALEPCGAKLRAVLLALAGATEPKPAVRCFRHRSWPDGQKVDRVRWNGHKYVSIMLDGSEKDQGWVTQTIETSPNWLEVQDAPYQKPEPDPDLPYCLPADVKNEIEFLCDMFKIKFPATVAHVRAALEQTRGV